MPTNFLDAAGTNGLIQSAFTLMSTELNSLTSGGAATSSVNGSSGVFTQSSYSNAIWAPVWFQAGGSFSPTAGGALVGWFLLSPDGGSTFEAAISTPSTTVPALPRSPDFIIPLDSSGTYSSSTIKWCAGRFVKAPWESHKVLIQNLSGTTLPASGNLIKAAGVAVQY
jgi:hypothetical protein